MVDQCFKILNRVPAYLKQLIVLSILTPFITKSVEKWDWVGQKLIFRAGPKITVMRQSKYTKMTIKSLSKGVWRWFKCPDMCFWGQETDCKWVKAIIYFRNIKILKFCYCYSLKTTKFDNFNILRVGVLKFHPISVHK